MGIDNQAIRACEDPRFESAGPARKTRVSDGNLLRSLPVTAGGESKLAILPPNPMRHGAVS